MYNILLVEDDKDIQLVNSNMLKRHGGYNVYCADDLTIAREMVANEDLDMIVLDIMLPDGSGLDYLKELRQEKDIPVLLLTALSETSDEIKGLRAGGDDYLTKPYDIEVLLLRIEILLRKVENVPNVVKKGALTLRINSNQAFVNGIDLLLTKDIEFSLLNLFVKNENKILSAEYLYSEAWGRLMKEDEGAVRKAVNRLRPKIEGSGYTITTEHSKGYCFEKG